MKRIGLFLITNLLVVLAIGLISSVIIRVYPGLSINLVYLLVFSFIWGMVGSFISLLLSKPLAKKLYPMHMITFSDPSPEYQELRMTIEYFSKKAGIKTPEIGIYDSEDVNAFATGATKNSSLVAISYPLVQNMTKDEIEGVIAHEISHIANGDMVTMTLLQGIINSFVLFFARVVAQMILQDKDGGRGFSWIIYFIVVSILQTIFMMFGSVIIAAFSRKREYRADEGGAKLAGKDSMVAALHRLQSIEPDNKKVVDKEMKAFKIFGARTFFSFLFATHPPLDKRIKNILKSN